jgi:hypothetical protein
MSQGVLAFQRRAARVLASDEPPELAALDALITDGCAEALQIEMEIRRLARWRDDLLRQLDRPDGARAVVEIGERLGELEERLLGVQDAIRALMRRRSRQRLSEFMSDR